MSIIKHDPSEGRWEAVPRALVQNDELSIDARFLVTWLLMKPEGWQIHPDHCKSALKISKEKWGKITAELIAAGHWLRIDERQKNGQIKTRIELRATPLSPGAGLPAAGEPAVGQPVAGGPAPLINTDQNKTNINNNNQKQQGVVVDFDDDLVKSGLINLVEKNQIFKILSGIQELNRQQILMDELAGAIRARGRTGVRAIKNPARFLSTFLNSAELNYSPGEAQLRAGRAAAAARSAAILNTKTECQGGPPPPEIRAQIDKIRHSAGIKKG